MTAGWAAFVLAVFTGIVIPLAVMVVHGVVKWTRIQDRLDAVIVDLRELVDEVKQNHGATDRRLRWLEENLWKRRRGGNAVQGRQG